jgi:hypothetical protein
VKIIIVKHKEKITKEIDRIDRKGKRMHEEKSQEVVG